jgi:prepilin-type N-terminal cleavage/methylation domain-containing protein
MKSPTRGPDLRRPDGGITLIEVLVVITIFGLVIALLPADRPSAVAVASRSGSAETRTGTGARDRIPSAAVGCAAS